MLAVDALTEAGFAVEEAARAEEAIEILKAGALAIDVVFTDIQMPGRLNGLDLAAYVNVHWPRIAVMLTSGRVVPALNCLPHCTRFLAKPYVLGEVVTRIHELAAAR